MSATQPAAEKWPAVTTISFEAECVGCCKIANPLIAEQISPDMSTSVIESVRSVQSDRMA
jgi:hypothetical protein